MDDLIQGDQKPAAVSVVSAVSGRVEAAVAVLMRGDNENST